MEDNQKQAEPQLKVERECALTGCSNMFTPMYSHQKYCCDGHRAKAHKQNKKSNLGNISADTIDPVGEPSQPAPQPSASTSLLDSPRERKDPPMPVNLNDQTSRFIIDQITQDRNYWREEWKDEREARRKVIAEKEKLQRDFDELNKKIEIDEIRGEKKSSLGALLESPATKELMPFVGPAIGELMNGIAKIATSKMAGGMAGLNNAPGAGLPGTSGEIMSAIASWLPTQQEETQKLFYAMIKPMIESPEDQAAAFFQHIVTFMQNGNRRATGTEGQSYGY